MTEWRYLNRHLLAIKDTCLRGAQSLCLLLASIFTACLINTPTCGLRRIVSTTTPNGKGLSLSPSLLSLISTTRERQNAMHRFGPTGSLLASHIQCVITLCNTIISVN